MCEPRHPRDTWLPRSRAGIGSGRLVGDPLPWGTVGEAEERCPLLGGRWWKEGPAWDPRAPPPLARCCPEAPIPQHTCQEATSAGRPASPSK